MRGTEYVVVRDECPAAHMTPATVYFLAQGGHPRVGPDGTTLPWPFNARTDPETGADQLDVKATIF